MVAGALWGSYRLGLMRARFLLILMIVTWTAVVRAESPQRLAEWVVDQGGAVEYEGNDPSKAVVKARVIELNDKLLERLAGAFGELRELEASFSDATATGLGRLRNLKRLRALALMSATVDDESMKQIGALAELRSLSLHGNGVTDARLASLGRLVHLENLDLEQAEISGAGLAVVKNFPELRSVNL